MLPHLGALKCQRDSRAARLASAHHGDVRLTRSELQTRARWLGGRDKTHLPRGDGRLTSYMKRVRRNKLH